MLAQLKKASLALSMLTVLALAAPAAHAFELGVYGQLNNTSPVLVPDNSSYKSKMSFGMGATVEFSMLPMVGLQIGGFLTPYSQRLEATANNYTDATTQYLQIPVLVRVNAIPFLSLGAGGYYATSMGKTTSKAYVNGTLDNEQQLGVPDDKTTDYGLALSAAYQMPLAPLVKLVVDARYLIGLRDMDSSAVRTSKFNQLQLLGGVTIGF